MAVPRRINPSSLNDYLEVMTIGVFQAGVSWALVEGKWDGFRRAFKKFDVQKVAAFTADDIDRLTEDESILLSCKKIAATVKNAQTMLELDARPGGFKKYLRSFDSYDQLSADLRKKFKFVGELTVYY